MSVVGFEDIYTDVICQMNKEGKVIPLRIRFQDEDGQYQTYMIKSYMQINQGSNVTVSDDVVLPMQHKLFDCKIAVWGQLRTIRLFYNCTDSKWKIIKR